MTKLSGRRVLITGASGVVAYPVAVKLAEANEVFAVARFSDPEQSRSLEQAGVQPIPFDLANPDLSPLPESVDVVINYAVLPPSHKDAYQVNAGATGRLARRYRDCEAFVHGSTGSLYAYQGERPLREDDPYGLIPQRRTMRRARYRRSFWSSISARTTNCQRPSCGSSPSTVHVAAASLSASTR